MSLWSLVCVYVLPFRNKKHFRLAKWNRTITFFSSSRQTQQKPSLCSLLDWGLSIQRFFFPGSAKLGRIYIYGQKKERQLAGPALLHVFIVSRALSQINHVCAQRKLSGTKSCAKSAFKESPKSLCKYPMKSLSRFSWTCPIRLSFCYQLVKWSEFEIWSLSSWDWLGSDEEWMTSVSVCMCVCVHTCMWAHSFLLAAALPFAQNCWPASFPFSFTIRWPASCCITLRNPARWGLMLLLSSHPPGSLRWRNLR